MASPALRRCVRWTEEHLFLGNHANTGSVLNLLNLQTLAADDGAHLVVRDQETDGCMG